MSEFKIIENPYPDRELISLAVTLQRRKLTLATELVNTVALMIGNSIYGVRLS